MCDHNTPYISEREESPQGFTGALDFDPAYPEVFFLMVKWYWRPQELADTLLQLYPLVPNANSLIILWEVYMLLQGQLSGN